MRIGITGAAGTGKTRVATDLAAALGVPVIPDYTEIVLKEEAKGTWRGIKDTRVRKNIRMAAIVRKMKAEAAAESFVSDRTVVDYLAYWIMNQAEFETKEQNWSIIDLIRPHVPRYTHRLLLPFRADIDWAENRNQDPLHNFKLSAMKRGLFDQLGAPVIETPYTFGEDMQAWIAKWLAATKAEAAPPKKAAAKKKAK